MGHSKSIFFQDGVQDGRQTYEHMHMVYSQFRCTDMLYLVIILHVSSIHHIKYFLFFEI